TSAPRADAARRARSRARQGGVIDTRRDTSQARSGASRAGVQVFGVDERVEVSDADPDALDHS
ncbi:MAG TPA: hypothetical protein VE932_13855, partial [Patescibacteria group bacterium]|nr:hypothetical protein [Patescibacteria group bacterium]